MRDSKRAVEQSTILSTQLQNPMEHGAMVVTLEDIKSKFEDLCSGAEPRDNFSKFAMRAMEKNDIGLLVLEKEHEDVIWKSILYFSGVDLEVSPNDYLHSVHDFEDKRKCLGL